MPLDGLMDNWKDILPEDALAGFNQNDSQFAVPTKQTFVDIIYYNKEMFAGVGYDQFPATYDEFIDAVKAEGSRHYADLPGQQREMAASIVLLVDYR